MSHHQPVRTSARLLGGSFYKVCIAALSLAALAFGLRAQDAAAVDAPAKGTIEGRVLNMSNGKYLSKAVVAVPGTQLTTLTNDYGEYTLRNVPAGTVSVSASFTGQEPRTASVIVEAGKTVNQDFGLNSSKAVLDDGTIVLDPVTVAQDRFKNAQEIAINEERRSANIKDVVATDSLGYIPSGNVGEFVKYIPGVQTLYGGTDAFGGSGFGGVNASNASLVSVRGFGAADTVVMIDGVAMSGVGPGALTRAIGLDMMSINNASRIEVIKVPTPDMVDANSAGGAINLVTKSAFEYSKPTYTGDLSFSFNTSDKLESFYKKQPGPANKKTYHTLPSASLSVAVPVTKDFGFSVSVAQSNSYSSNYKIQAAWQNTYSTAYGSTTATVAGTGNGNRPPMDTPYNTSSWTTTSVSGTRTTTYYNVGNLADGRLSTLENPFLRQATDQQNPWKEKRNSASLKLDWKPVTGLLLSASYTGSTYEGINVDRRLQVSIQGPMEWGPDYVIGRPYENTVTGVHGTLDTRNSLNNEVTSRDKSGVTHTGYLRMNYARGPWTIDGTVGISKTTMDLDDFENGHAYSVVVKTTIGQAIFRDIKNGVPGTIETYRRDGSLFDFHDLSQWEPDTVDIGTGKSQNTDRSDEYRLSVKRELDFLPFSSALKVGGSRRVKDQAKSGLGTGYKLRYIGPSLTADPATRAEFMQNIVDRNFTREGGLGFAIGQQWGDTYRMYDMYKANPSLFNADADVGLSTANYRSVIGQTKSVKETSDSYFVMLESSFFENRLSVVTGFNQSRSEVVGYQPFSDSKWNFVKNPDGTMYRDQFYLTGVRFDGGNSTRTNYNSDGTIAGTTSVRDWLSGATRDQALIDRLAAAGITDYPSQLILNASGGTATTGNSLEAQKRALYTKRVDRSRTNPISPSVIAGYNITKDLVFKPSWSREVQLPALDAGNGNTGGLLGTFQLSENDTPSGAVGGAGSVKISNPGLKPKKVDALNFQLAYYTKNGGKLAANYYYKFIKNEWLTTNFTRTSPEFEGLLNDLNLDYESFQDWTINTTENSNEKSNASGYELEFRQNFGFLGELGSHVNAFGNYSHKKVKQTNKEGVIAMTSFPSNTWAGGVNVSAYRASFTVKVVFQDELWEKTGAGVVFGTNSDGTERKIQLYNVTPKTYKVKLDFDYQLTDNFSFFASADNVTNSKRITRQKDALGIIPEYAWVTTNYEFGVQIATGIRAQF